MTEQVDAQKNIVRLIHFSDLHIALPEIIPKWRPRAELHRLCREAREPDPKARVVEHRQKSMDRLVGWTTGHHPRALAALRQSVESYLEQSNATDTHWTPAQTRLAVTGDLTAIGDTPSLNYALEEIAKIAHPWTREPWVIHGNHDVWSGNPEAPLPVYYGPDYLAERHRHVIRDISAKFPTKHGHDFPRLLGRFRLTGRRRNARELVFWAINTVTHEPLANSMALGEAETNLYGSDANQLEELCARMNPWDINVVLCHHPIYDPFNGHRHHETPLGRMCLGDGHETSRRLGRADETHGPLVNLFISGHVHRVFPDPGAINRSRDPECYLGPDQHQLIIGSACQASFPSEDLRVPESEHQEPSDGFDGICYWQALSFVLDESVNPKLVVQREVFQRSPAGEFEPIHSPGDCLEVSIPAASITSS